MQINKHVLLKLRELLDRADSPLDIYLPQVMDGSVKDRTKLEHDTALGIEDLRPVGQLRSSVGRTDNWFEIHPTSPYCRRRLENPLVVAGALCTLLHVFLSHDQALKEVIAGHAAALGISLEQARVDEIGLRTNMGAIMLETTNMQGQTRALPKILVSERLFMTETEKETDAYRRLMNITPLEMVNTVEGLRARFKGRPERGQG